MRPPRDVAALPPEEAPGFALGRLQAGSLQVVARPTIALSPASRSASAATISG